MQSSMNGHPLGGATVMPQAESPTQRLNERFHPFQIKSVEDSMVEGNSGLLGDNTSTSE